MNPAHKPWTDRQERLLGTATDAAIAAKFGRSRKAVETKRRKRGIPGHVPHTRAWTKREIKLLGTMSDAAVARRLGCCSNHVLKTRRRLGVPPFSPHNTPRKFRGK